MKDKIKNIIVIWCAIILIVGIIFIDNIDNKKQNVVLEEEHLVKDKINSITIKYYEWYSYAEAGKIGIIPLNTIEIDNEDLEKMAKLIKKIKTHVYSSKMETSNEETEIVCDFYILVVNMFF